MNNHILSEFLFGKKWKMRRKLESICGSGSINKFTTIARNMLIVGIVIFAVIMLLQVAGIFEVPSKRIDEDGTITFYFSQFIDTNGTSAALYNPKEVLEMVFSGLTIFATLYTCIQIYLMKDINRMEMSHQIYKDNQEYRKLADMARKELEKLYKNVKEQEISVESERILNEKNEDSKFHTLLLNGEYETLRSFAYHYEYIGYLTLRDKLNFDVAFDTITFYNWLIVSDEALEIIKIGRQSTPDFWNGSEYLYRSYEVRRKYNKFKGYDNATPEEKARTTKKALKEDFETACKNWKDKYIKIS